MTRQFSELTRFQQWAVCAAIGNISDSGITGPFESIQIVINGVEVDALMLLDRLEEEHRRLVTVEVLQTIVNKYQDLIRQLDALTEEVEIIGKPFIDKIRSELGVYNED